MAGQYSSPTLVLGFTVERYIAVCHPFRKQRYCTATVAARVSVAMVTFCLAIASAQVRPCCCVLLLARLMGQYCSARWRLSSSVVCNTAGGRWVGLAAGRRGGRAADTPQRASSVTSR